MATIQGNTSGHKPAKTELELEIEKLERLSDAARKLQSARETLQHFHARQARLLPALEARVEAAEAAYKQAQAEADR